MEKTENKKTIKTIALSIVTILFVGTLLVLVFKEIYTEKDININNEVFINDSDKFEKEFESINDLSIDDRTYRTINISNPNPMKYSDAKTIEEKINNKETFLVYFGYAKCEWCRTTIEYLINQANEYNIENIYYINVEDMRDEYKLDADNNVVLVKEALDDYKLLLNLFNPILDYYKFNDNELAEKRIYAPTLVLVKEGVATIKTNGIAESITDPYQNLSDNMIQETKELFNSIFSEYNKSGSNSCDGNKC